MSSTASWDMPAGTRFAGYRITDVIGRGGMSIVYAAEHIQLGRRIALKLMAPQLASDDSFRERFIRESQIAASLEHPNVVPIYDAGESDGFLYIAMRYVEGTDLRTLIKRQAPLGLGQTLFLLEQVAGALDAAHERGLVHRDIKPANILVSQPSDRVYLTDFGVAKAMSSPGLTKTGVLRGHVRVRGARAARGEADRRAHRPVRARVRALRVPERRGALQGARPRRRSSTPTSSSRRRSSRRRARPAGRAERGGLARDGEGQGGALRQLRRASERRPPRGPRHLRRPGDRAPAPGHGAGLGHGRDDARAARAGPADDAAARAAPERGGAGNGAAARPRRAADGHAHDRSDARDRRRRSWRSW